MERIYQEIVTFLTGLDPLLKGVILGMLCLMILLTARSIVKSHVNAKKTVFKLGQFIFLAILVGLTIFVSANVF